MRLTFGESTEAFRPEFVAWLGANLPDATTTGERPMSSADIPHFGTSSRHRRHVARLAFGGA